MTPEIASQALMGKPQPGPLSTAPPKDGAMSFYLIRHGATELNSQGGTNKVDKIRGWRNVPLNDKGRQEAKELGEKLKDSGIKVLVHSDMDRAIETAQAIADTTGAKMIASPLLRPWNVGIYTGRNSNEAHPELVKMATNTPDEPIPNGESFNQFKHRAFQGMKQALMEGQGQAMGIVTHHRVERLYNAWRAAGEPEDFSIDLKTMFSHGEDPAAYQVFKVNPKALEDNG
jgi:broad specificity phosphatase PhoE